jgi:hypothetical protein
MKLKDFIETSLDEAKKKTTLDSSIGECEECGKEGKVYEYNDKHDFQTSLCKKCLLKKKQEK